MQQNAYHIGDKEMAFHYLWIYAPITSLYIGPYRITIPSRICIFFVCIVLYIKLDTYFLKSCSIRCIYTFKFSPKWTSYEYILGFCGCNIYSYLNICSDCIINLKTLRIFSKVKPSNVRFILEIIQNDITNYDINHKPCMKTVFAINWQVSSENIILKLG